MLNICMNNTNNCCMNFYTYNIEFIAISICGSKYVCIDYIRDRFTWNFNIKVTDSKEKINNCQFSVIVKTFTKMLSLLTSTQ